MVSSLLRRGSTKGENFVTEPRAGHVWDGKCSMVMTSPGEEGLKLLKHGGESSASYDVWRSPHAGGPRFGSAVTRKQL